MFLLKKKRALVTGASKGLGREIALTLAQIGADVVLVSRSDEKALQKVSREIHALGGKSCYYLTDISSEKDVQSLFKKVARDFGGLDILINNAGHSAQKSWGSDLQKISLEDFERTLAVDVCGTFLMCRAGYPLLKKTKGCVVNVSSSAALQGDPVVLLYAAAKAGIHGFTKALASAWAPYVRVNAVAPGAIRTGWIETWKVPPQDIKRIESATPLQRLGEPSDIAQAVLYLVSDMASYVTGQTLIIDGGVFKI